MLMSFLRHEAGTTPVEIGLQIAIMIAGSLATVRALGLNLTIF